MGKKTKRAYIPVRKEDESGRRRVVAERIATVEEAGVVEEDWGQERHIWAREDDGLVLLLYRSLGISGNSTLSDEDLPPPALPRMCLRGLPSLSNVAELKQLRTDLSPRMWIE